MTAAIDKAHYGEFNARWLSPEQVATTFVPIPQFRQLVHSTHSLLLGPRGCGKTTLLKMLTRRALDVWYRIGRDKRFEGTFDRPNYEAIYIPSDIRWSYELTGIREQLLDPVIVAQAQRVLVTCSALRAIAQTAWDLSVNDSTLQLHLSSGLVKLWELKNTLPQFRDIKTSLEKIVPTIRGLLNSADDRRMRQFLSDLEPVFYAHALDAPIAACAFLRDESDDVSASASWALCFDELEISPEWLREELLTALRSVWQGILLKLTWSPLLPSGLPTAPEQFADFRPIRLWNSYVQDPRVFCENLTREFLVERFPTARVSPDEFLSRSMLASEPNEELPAAYERGSTEYVVYKALAASDGSFRGLLQDYEIDPVDPQPKSLAEKDRFFRKVKPVALLRETFLFGDRVRSRKAVTLYAGKEAVYALSEGNPRWLLGLLNDLADLGTSMSDLASRGTAKVQYSDQARILASASHRFVALVRATPARPSGAVPAIDLIEAIGTGFKDALYGTRFPLDPIGSFTVPEGISPPLRNALEQLLELGALIYIGGASQVTPTALEGSRIRLTFMLAPYFRLPFRIYRAIDLSELLGTGTYPGQLELGFVQSHEN